MKVSKSFLLLLLFFLPFFPASCEAPERIENKPDEFFSRWMDSVADETRIRDIVIPGSHDGASVGMSPLALTQNSSVRTQLAYGVRYFDLRVQKKGDELVIFHGPVSGQPFQKVLASVKAFLDASPSETVILDFQHFKGEAQADTLAAISAIVNPQQYAVKAPAGSDPVVFTDTLKMKECRGKYILFWGRQYETGDVKNKDFVFFRNNDEGTLKNCAMESYYNGSLHRKSSEKFIAEALPDYYSRFEKKNKGLFVLQCQLTGQTLLTTPLSREEEHDQNITAYIDGIAEDSRRLSLTNIVMRDFLTDDIRKIKSILRLNTIKESVLIEEKADEFRLKTEQ